VFELLVSGVSQRRAAKLLRVNRKTIVRKFIFLGLHAKEYLLLTNREKPKATAVQFDDLETFEHTKCKPLSLTMVVEEGTRRILGFRVSQMPANGLLAAISRKKYGLRPDHRRKGREELFTEVKEFIFPGATIKSDQNPHYVKDVKKHFPGSVHTTCKGQRGCVTGQGELKAIGHDPIFSLNHTFAMGRANMNRLFRRTWCTTKLAERLSLHFALYAVYHNLNLIPQ
jgi:ribosomal protein L13E